MMAARMMKFAATRKVGEIIVVVILQQIVQLAVNRIK
jgi:hypothetical protein